MADRQTLDRGRPGRRIAVIGTSGSGKTTMAARIARRLDVAHVELDALHWEPNWTEAPIDIFRSRVAEALSPEAWAVDGNYGKVRDLIWGSADTIVWLDYSLAVIMGRLLWRTVSRVVTREQLWGNNRESVRNTFLSRDSILLWALQTYKRHRRDYPRLLTQPEYRHLAVVHLRSPRAARRFLASLN